MVLQYGYINDGMLVTPPQLRKVSLTPTGNSAFTFTGKLDEILAWLDNHSHLIFEIEKDVQFDTSNEGTLAIHVQSTPVQSPGWFGIPMSIDGVTVEIRIAGLKNSIDLNENSWKLQEDASSFIVTAGSIAEKAIGSMLRGDGKKDLALILIKSRINAGRISHLIRKYPSGWKDAKNDFENFGEIGSPNVDALPLSPISQSVMVRYGYIQENTLVTPPHLQKVGLSPTGYTSFSITGKFNDVIGWMDQHSSLPIEVHSDPSFKSTITSIAIDVKAIPIESATTGWFGIPYHTEGIICEIRIAGMNHGDSDFNSEKWAEMDQYNSGVLGVTMDFAERTIGTLWKNNTINSKSLCLILMKSENKIVGDVSKLMTKFTNGWHDTR